MVILCFDIAQHSFGVLQKLLSLQLSYNPILDPLLSLSIPLIMFHTLIA